MAQLQSVVRSAGTCTRHSNYSQNETVLKYTHARTYTHNVAEWTFQAVIHPSGLFRTFILKCRIHFAASIQYWEPLPLGHGLCKPPKSYGWHIVSRNFLHPHSVCACMSDNHTNLYFTCLFSGHRNHTSHSTLNLVVWRLNGLMVRQKPTSHLFAFHFHEHERKSHWHGENMRRTEIRCVCISGARDEIHNNK